MKKFYLATLEIIFGWKCRILSFLSMYFEFTGLRHIWKFMLDQLMRKKMSRGSHI